MQCLCSNAVKTLMIKVTNRILFSQTEEPIESRQHLLLIGSLVQRYELGAVKRSKFRTKVLLPSNGDCTQIWLSINNLSTKCPTRELQSFLSNSVFCGKCVLEGGNFGVMHDKKMELVCVRVMCLVFCYFFLHVMKAIYL